jgi:hypothetical protein
MNNLQNHIADRNTPASFTFAGFQVGVFLSVMSARL